MMDVKRLKRDKNKRGNARVDRISQLSDDIIVEILSNLPFRDAASTSALSSRWKDLWRYIPVLDVTQYGKYIGNMKKFKRLKKSIVKNHKAHSLKKLSLSLDLDRSSLPAITPAITKLLEFAVSKRVEVIELVGLPYNPAHNYVALDALKFIPKASNILKLSYLRSLHLQRFDVSGEAMEMILHNCYLLERLTIDKANFTSDIDIRGGADGLKLKHLEIHSWVNKTLIKVDAPNLTYLGIDGRERMICVENVPKLVELTLVDGEPSILQKYSFVSQLQILNVDIFFQQIYSAKGIPTMPKLMELNVTYFGRSNNLLPTLTSLVRASPLLQTFKLQFWERNNGYEMDTEVVNVEAFEHRNLKVFRFRGFDIGVAHHMEPVSFILDNCVALRKLIIQVCKTKKKLLKLNMENVKQLIQPRLQNHVELQVISPI